MTDSYLGIDVSRHNGAIDYQRSAAAGVKFAAIRCTVGDYYSDPRFSEHWQGFRDAGILVSAYHVVAPANSSNKPISAEAQMDRFLAALESRLPDYPLILDCELACGRDKQAVSAIILGCCRRLLGSSGYAYPLIYTRKTWVGRACQPQPRLEAAPTVGGALYYRPAALAAARLGGIPGLAVHQQGQRRAVRR